MSYDDFCMMTEAEFAEVFKAWSEQRKEGWSMMRMHAFLSLQPYCKKGADFGPSDLLPFPWESQSEEESMTKEERIERIKQVAKAWNNE